MDAMRILAVIVIIRGVAILNAIRELEGPELREELLLVFLRARSGTARGGGIGDGKLTC